MNLKRKGIFTIRSAGALFLLSALFEFCSVNSEVSLFGAIRSGYFSVVYHLMYALLFLAIGIGIWKAKKWGYKLVFIGTLIYTLDNVIWLFDRKSMETYLINQLRGYGEIGQLFDTEFLLQVITVTTIMFIACWWGFALYIYMRQDYFRTMGDKTGFDSSTEDRS